jgi:hypothetical protein
MAILPLLATEPDSPRLSTKSERRWALVFAIVVMLATTVPYLLGYFAQDTDWRFTGFVLSVEDGNAFIGKMRSGTAGEWLFRTPYTALPQRGFLIFLPYILLGKVLPPPGSHGQLVALYHLFRVCAGVLALLATYDFLSLFVTTVRHRRFGLALAAVGGGLGWLLVLLGARDWLDSLPLDFYSPETFGFLSLYAYPHYALARALLLWGLVAYLKAAAHLDGDRSIAIEGLKIGPLWLLTGLAQPFTGMMVVMAVGLYLFALAAWQVWRKSRQELTDWPHLWKMTKLAVWAGLLPAPFLLYNLISTRLDPFLKLWTEQSYFGSPHPLHYLLAYGLILPFAVGGARHLWRLGDWTAKFPVAWAIFLPLLVYAPVSIQRRLPEGIWVALVVLTMKALESIKSPSRQSVGKVLLLAFPSALFLLVGGALVTTRPAEPAFRPAGEVAAFQSLAGTTGRQAAVLSSYETGNALPAWTPVFVVVGHGPESVGLAELLPRITAFYQAGTPDSARIELLEEFGVDYVFWGPHERALGNWEPSGADFLSPFYQSEGYSIFTVEIR